LFLANIPIVWTLREEREKRKGGREAEASALH